MVKIRDLSKINSLYGSTTRKVRKSGKIILPNSYFEYFKINTLVPNYSKFKEGKYNLILLNESRHTSKEYLDRSAIITVKKELILPNDALDYLNNPSEVFLLGMIDTLEVWNNKDFKKYDIFNSKPLDQIFNESDLEEFGKIPF